MRALNAKGVLPLHSVGFRNVELLENVKHSRLMRQLLRSKKWRRLLLSVTPKRRCISFKEAIDNFDLEASELLATEYVKRTSFEFIGHTKRHDLQALTVGGYHFPSMNLLKLHDAVVTGASCLIGFDGFLVHHDLLDLNQQKLREEDLCRLRVLLPSKYAQGPIKNKILMSVDKAAIFTDSVSFNYAHWLTEVLPRVCLLSDFKEYADLPFVVDADLHVNLYRSLCLVAGEARKIILTPPECQVLIREAWCVGVAGYIPYANRRNIESKQNRSMLLHGIFMPSVLKAMVSIIKRRVEKVLPSFGSRIYVRRNSELRNLVNSQEVEDYLTGALGFSVVEPDQMSFDEQVDAFSKADVVVGPTGAGMANLIFCKPGSRAFVFMAYNQKTPYTYWANMGHAVGVYVTCVLCDQIDHRRDVHDDFWLSENNFDELKRSLRQIVSNYS